MTKSGARRDASGAWLPVWSREDLVQAAHDNLRNLGLEAREVVNLRSMLSAQARWKC